MNEKQQWSKPDYDGWKNGVREVANLPSPRFYFAVTLLAMVAIAYALIRHGAHSAAGFSIAVLILIFGAAAFVMQRKREGNDQTIKDPEVESADQPNGANTPSESCRDDERREFD